MRLVDLIQERIPWDHFSDMELRTLLPGSDHARYGVVRRAITAGALLHLRRGLYCLAERYRRRGLNLFVLAQKIYGPSYVSCESALSYHQWIPEAVYTVTCATTKRARIFQTPLGNFAYVRVRATPFLTDVDRIALDGESYFLARPWRAIVDYLVTNRLAWRGITPLIESLRIDDALLAQTTPDELASLETTFRERRVIRFLTGVRKDLRI